MGNKMCIAYKQNHGADPDLLPPHLNEPHANCTLQHAEGPRAFIIPSIYQKNKRPHARREACRVKSVKRDRIGCRGPPLRFSFTVKPSRTFPSSTVKPYGEPPRPGPRRRQRAAQPEAARQHERRGRAAQAAFASRAATRVEPV
jgi:hypothetical protein